MSFIGKFRSRYDKTMAHCPAPRVDDGALRCYMSMYSVRTPQVKMPGKDVKHVWHTKEAPSITNIKHYANITNRRQEALQHDPFLNGLPVHKFTMGVESADSDLSKNNYGKQKLKYHMIVKFK